MYKLMVLIIRTPNTAKEFFRLTFLKLRVYSLAVQFMNWNVRRKENNLTNMAEGEKKIEYQKSLEQSKTTRDRLKVNRRVHKERAIEAGNKDYDRIMENSVKRIDYEEEINTVVNANEEIDGFVKFLRVNKEKYNSMGQHAKAQYLKRRIEKFFGFNFEQILDHYDETKDINKAVADAKKQSGL